MLSPALTRASASSRPISVMPIHEITKPASARFGGAAEVRRDTQGLTTCRKDATTLREPVRADAADRIDRRLPICSKSKGGFAPRDVAGRGSALARVDVRSDSREQSLVHPRWLHSRVHHLDEPV